MCKSFKSLRQNSNLSLPKDILQQQKLFGKSLRMIDASLNSCEMCRNYGSFGFSTIPWPSVRKTEFQNDSTHF
jgi:hypothetical protein